MQKTENNQLQRLGKLADLLAEPLPSSDFIGYGYSWSRRLNAILQEQEQRAFEERTKVLHEIIERKDIEIARLHKLIETLVFTDK